MFPLSSSFSSLLSFRRVPRGKLDWNKSSRQFLSALHLSLRRMRLRGSIETPAREMELKLHESFRYYYYLQNYIVFFRHIINLLLMTRIIIFLIFLIQNLFLILYKINLLLIWKQLCIYWIENFIVSRNSSKTINFKIVPVIYDKVSMDQR